MDAALKKINSQRLSVYMSKQAAEGFGSKAMGAGRAFVDLIDNPLDGGATGSMFKGMSPVEKLKSLLLGEKATSGPMAGSRLHPVKGGLEQSHRMVSKEVADKIIKGKIKGDVTIGAVGNKPAYFAQKFRPKGAVGWGMRNPGKAGLAALAAYMLLKPEGRQMASGMASGLAPKAPKGPTEEVQREWGQQQQSARPVLQQQAWG